MRGRGGRRMKKRGTSIRQCPREGCGNRGKGARWKGEAGRGNRGPAELGFAGCRGGSQGRISSSDAIARGWVPMWCCAFHDDAASDRRSATLAPSLVKFAEDVEPPLPRSLSACCIACTLASRVAGGGSRRCVPACCTLPSPPLPCPASPSVLPGVGFS
jgi:hypothetical protein